jgi:hypothetical protein
VQDTRNENGSVNFNWKENRIPLQALLGVLLCIFLTGLFYVITFRRPSVLGLEVASRANSTKTALALTSRALYGPFPTATGPTPTVTKTPTITPTPTLTPSKTPSPTPIRYYIDTATPRTPIPSGGATSIPGSTAAPAPTNPPIQPPQPPVQPTQPAVQPPPQPTQAPPQPTQPPAQPTKKACLNPQGHPVPCH